MGTQLEVSFGLKTLLFVCAVAMMATLGYLVFKSNDFIYSASDETESTVTKSRAGSSTTGSSVSDPSCETNSMIKNQNCL